MRRRTISSTHITLPLNICISLYGWFGRMYGCMLIYRYYMSIDKIHITYIHTICTHYMYINVCGGVCMWT